jgi:hypothetical protein
VTTSGVVPPANNSTTPGPQVVFSAVGQEAAVDIVASDLIMQVSPTKAFGDGAKDFTIKLIDQAGNPVNDVLILATCEATGAGELTVTVAPGKTGQPQSIAQCNGVSGQNCPGTTTARITASNFECTGGVPSGTCTFKTTTGTPSQDVQFIGVDGASFSPPLPACPGG